MKILLVTYWYLPHVGGVNTYINVLRNELIRMGHEVDVLAHHTEKNDKVYMLTTGKYVEKKKIKDIVYNKVFNYYEKHQPSVDHWIRWREIERYSFELAVSLFDLSQYDLIHTQDIISTRAVARVKPDHIPLVATIHGFLATEHIIAGDITSEKSIPWKYVLAEEYYGATSSLKTIVPTDWLKNLLTHKSVNVPSSHLTTIPYGMDINEFLTKYESPAAGYIPLSTNKTVFICPARMVPVKGHRTLLNALAKLKEKRNDFTCWLIGSGPLLYKMQNLANQLNLQEHVYFLGDRNDVPQLLKQSDVLILPSVQDNHPFTIMEAQVAGKLVIASDAGGIPEMVKDGYSGLLFPVKDSSQLARLLYSALDDPLRRNKIALQGMKWGHKQWAPSTLANRTLEVYHQFTPKA